MPLITTVTSLPILAGGNLFVSIRYSTMFCLTHSSGVSATNLLLHRSKMRRPSSVSFILKEYLGKFKSFFGLGDVNVNVNGSSGHQATLAASAAQAISESHTTVTNRFAVDFSNVPRGTKITPPPKGDFDWSRGYMLGGV